MGEVGGAEDADVHFLGFGRWRRVGSIESRWGVCRVGFVGRVYGLIVRDARM